MSIINMQKVDITTRYNEEEEVRTDTKPYLDYAKCIINTFPMEQIKSFCDIGCATGHLLYSLKQYNSSLDIRGYEYFEYHKTSKYCKIKDSITIYDIRDKLPSESLEDSNLEPSLFDSSLDCSPFILFLLPLLSFSNINFSNTLSII